MATTSALSGLKGIFPLIAPDTDDRDYNKLARTVTGAGGGKRSALVPIANDPESLETICQTKIYFDDAAQDEQLRLNTAALKFQYFRMCLRDQVRVDWDNARDGKAIDDNGFNAAIADFFATYFLPTDLGDQIFWLQRQIMPKGVSVTAFVSRVKQINKFLSLLPGANGEVPFDDDPGNAKPTLKSVLYEMMPHEWKTKFLDNDNDITDAGYTTARLERFMKVREKAEEVMNKALKRKIYPIPKINEIFGRRKNYEFLSKIDLSMQYYTFELDDESAELCTFATPFGLYRYQRLPMGITCSPDIAQSIMEKLLKDIDDLEVYIDDIALFSKDWNQHLQKIKELLSRLDEKGFSVNPAKCEWGVKETDFLGHWLTPKGIKPWYKKVKAIVNMDEPTISNLVQ